MVAVPVKKRSRRGEYRLRALRRAENRTIRLELLEDRRLLAIDLLGVPNWIEQGPGPIANGSTVLHTPSGGDTNPVAGAVEQIAVHPSNSDMAFIATVNGGVWRTENLTAETPAWTPLTDQYASLGIGAVAYEPGDATPTDFSDDVLYAGTGRFSSSRAGLIGTGVLKTTDGGQNWTLQGEDVFSGLNIRSIVPTRVPGVVLASTVDGRFKGGEFPHRGGLYGSLDGGDTWLRISGTIGEIGGVDFISNKLPDAPVSHVVADFSDTLVVLDKFFAAVPGRRVFDPMDPSRDETFAGRGIYRSLSLSGGLLWQDITGNLPAALLNNAIRIELAVSPAGNHTLFAAIINRDRQLSGIFRSVPGVGDTVIWTPLPGVPQPLEGKQGDLHFAIVADPTNDQVVYVGGDTNGPFVFDPAGNSWTQLVRENASNTFPHADARDLVFSGGALLEANDGGIVRLTTPNQSTRRWESLNGDLRITEFSRIAYDPVSDIVLGGTQDNGSVEMTPTILTTSAWSNQANSRNWTTQFLGDDVMGGAFATGDGNTQAVDASQSDHVIRYDMENNFRFFFRRAFDSNGVQIDLVDASHPCRDILEPPGSGVNLLTAPVLLASGASASARCTARGGLNALDRAFTGFTDIPFALNAVPGSENRMLLGLNGLYESHNRGDIVSNVTPPDRVLTRQCRSDCVHAIAYGGFEAGEPRPNVAYVGVGSELYFRPDDERASFNVLGAFGEASAGGLIQDIVMDPTNFRTVYVVTGRDVLRGTRIGERDASGNDLGQWTNIGAHLNNLIQVDQEAANQTIPLRSIEFAQVPATAGEPAHDVLLVGGVGGTYRLIDPEINDVWTKYGAGLPNVEVADLVYNRVDDLLIAATRGRGVWVVPAAGQTLATQGQLIVTGDDSPSNSFLLNRDPQRRGLLNVQAALATGLETKTVELTTLRSIEIFGLGGQDVLTISTVNGVIELPQGIFDIFDSQIFFDGGPDGDILQYLLASGDTLTQIPTPPPVPKLHVVHGSRGSSQGQHLSFQNVEEAPLAMVPDLESEIVAALGKGLTSIAQSDIFGQAFAVPLPVIGRSLGNVTQGAVAQLEPISDPRGGAAQTRTGAQNPGTTLLRRLLTEGQGAFPLSDVGGGITTFEELRERLDGLDTVVGNVQFTVFADGVVFDVQVEKVLAGLGDLDLRGLFRDVDIGGTAEISADVTLHMLFGFDSRGFFIDTDHNPDPEFSVGNLRITGAVEGHGRLGMTEVLLTAGTLALPPDVRVSADLLEPELDFGGDEEDGLIRLHELGSSSLRVEFADDPSLDDVVFTGVFSPAPVEVGQPAPFGLGPGEVTFRWDDISNPIIENASSVTGTKADGQPDAAGQELVAFLRSSTDELLIGLASLVGQFTTFGQVDVLGTNLSLTASTLGEVLDSSPRPLDIADADVASVSAPLAEGGFHKVNVRLHSATTLPQVSVARGDALHYFDTTGALVTDAVVDSVDDDSFTLRFTGAASRAPRPSAPFFQVQRGGSLAAQLAAFVNVAFAGDTAPTLQELARRLAASNGLSPGSIGLASSGSGDTRVVELTVDIDPGTLVYRRPFDLTSTVTGLDVPGLQDVEFTIDPSFRLIAGVRLAPGLGLGERFYLKDDAAPEISLQVSAVVDDPSGDGAVGFLNVRLQEDSSIGNNSGVSLVGTVNVNLADPKTIADDGRIAIGEFVTSDGAALANLLTSSIDLRADIDGLLVRAAVPGASTPPDMKLSLDGASNEGHLTSLNDLEQLPSKINVTNKDSFTSYNNITGNLVTDTFRALVDRLAELGRTGGFTTKLPLLNVNIADMINIGASFGSTIGEPSTGQVATAAALHAFLQSRFPGAQTAISGDDIRFTVGIPVSAVRTLPFGLDLGGALGSFASGGAINLSATGNVNLVFGVNTTAGSLEDRVFVTSDGTSNVAIDVTANAGYDLNDDGVLSPDEGQPLSFTAGLGPLPGLSVRDARVLADAQFGASWTGGANAKLTLANIGSENFSVVGTHNGQVFDGSIQAVIPVDGGDDGVVARDPTQLDAMDAWIDVAGKLTNLPGGFDFNSNPNQPAHHVGAPGQVGGGGVDDPLSSGELDALAPTQILVHSYNVGGLLDSLVSFDPNSFTGLLDGLDGFLNALQTLLDNSVLVKELPLIGSNLKDAVTFVDDLRDFVTAARGAATLDLLKQQMLESLGPGPGGANLLKDLDGGGVTISDIPVVLTKEGGTVSDPSQADRIEFRPVLHTDPVDVTLPINFDLGFDALGLSMNSAVNLAVRLDFRFVFGFSKTDGFYYDTSAADDLTISAKATLPNTDLTGQLAFLRVTASDRGTLLDVTVTADLKDPFGGDGRLTFTEFAQLPNASLGDLVNATVSARADVKLFLKADFGDEAFPDLSTDFHLNWQVAVGANSGPLAGAAPLVEFNNITLGLGSYINEFIKPIMNTVSDILEPVRPVLAILRTRIPGFSDLPQAVIDLAQLNGFDPKDEVSLLDLGKVYFASHPIFQAIEVIDLIDRIVTKFENSPGGEIGIPLGRFTINEDVRAKKDLQALAVNALGDVLNEIENVLGPIGDFARDLVDSTIGAAGIQIQNKPIFAMPLIEHPESAIKLLLGQHVNLLEVNVPVPPINQPIDLPFRFGPLVVGLEGLLKIDWHLAFGFDTYGISRAIETGDASKVFLGFFLADTLNLDGTGPDVPEVAVDAQLFVKGGLDIFVAEAIVRGGVFTDNLKIDLYEPPGASHDGKIRADELAQNWPSCVFESSGSLKAGLYAEVRVGVDLGLVEVKKTILSHTFDETTLVDLSYSCDPTKQAPPPPILATNVGGGVLRLNMGPFAAERIHGNLTDGNESFTVVHVGGGAGSEEVEVQAFGYKQRYSGVARIYAEGGLLDDKIILQAGVLAASELWGDFRDRPEFGNDVLEAGEGAATIHGGGGNDQIRGRSGNDLLYGDTGDDVIRAGAGNDTAEGGDGRDRLHGEAGLDTLLGQAHDDKLYGGEQNDSLDGGDGADELFGDGGHDTLVGGGGNDQLAGGAGDDHLHGSADNDVLQGDGGHDHLYGQDGNDRLSGGTEGDWLYGGEGKDELDGGAGDDELYGENGKDVLRGGAGSDSLEGGAGNDRLYGDGGNDKIQGGSDDDLLAGGADADTLDGGADDDHVHGNSGNDVIRGGMGSDVLRGEQGSDRYEIFLQGGDAHSLIDVADSVKFENDQLFITGTINDDTFLLRAAADAAVGGLAFVAMVNPDARVERTNYEGIERLVVSGSLGADHFAVDDVRGEATLDGGIGDDTFQFGQLYRSRRTPEDANVDPGDVFATIETTRGFLSNGITFPLTALGGPGNDTFVVFHNKATLSLFGESGDDTFAVKAFALVGSQDNVRERTEISGGAGADLVQYVVNANVNVDGGDGFDTLIVVGTEFSEDFVITRAGVFGAGLNVQFVNIESLQADGAEGDDRFFVQSTSEKFVTQLAGGLGSDTFNLAGDAPPVVSNDLRGHSGVILHDVQSDDLAYAGLKTRGISANVADNDEPAVVITQTGGTTVIQEGGFGDTYTIVLTRQPLVDVRVRVSAPNQTEEDKELRRRMFRVRSTAGGAVNDANTVTLLFTKDNWNVPQLVIVEAPNDDVNPADDYDDDALEGTRVGVISHVVESEDSIAGSPSTVVGNQFTDATAPFPLAGQGLRGRILEIVGGPGAGQERLILGNTADTLTLSGAFGVPPTAVSMYRIRLYDGLAVPSILVHVHDNDVAGVIIDEIDNSLDVIEGGNTDQFLIRLTRAPVGSVTVDLNGGGDVTLSPSSLTLDSNNWSTPHSITVTAVNDAVREGFHHGLIRFTVQSATDMGGVTPTVDVFDLSTAPNYFLGLRNTPSSPEEAMVIVNNVTLPSSRYQVVANKVVFLDDLGKPEIVSGIVVVCYSYAVPGYDGLPVEPILVNIGDDDAPGVVIRESNGSTDVIESDGDDGEPWTDTYTVVLTRQPSQDVIVLVKPRATKATRGVIDNELVQVNVFAAGSIPGADGAIQLVFTPQDWNQPKTVKVAAVNDAVVDGSDTQVFAPIPHTVNGIQGPLFIDGQGGLGSLLQFDPVMLPGETNIRKATGDVVSAEADAVTISKAEALSWLQTESSLSEKPGYVAKIGDLINKTVTIAEGPGAEQFRLIVDVSETGTGGENLRLKLNAPWDVSDDEVSDISKYALTEESLNFFVKEEEQVDFLLVFHEDNQANNVGRMTEDRLTGLGMGPDLVIGDSLQPGGVTYENLEASTLYFGDGQERFDVLGTLSRRDNFRTWTIIHTGAGNDIVRIVLNEQDQSVASGTVTSGGETTLTDTAASFPTAGRGLAGYQLRITGGTGMGQSHRIRFNTATEITVAATWKTPLDATSTYEIVDEADGLFAIDGEAGDDEIDASLSTLPIVIFGNDGTDKLTGGDGGDVIFGDRGRVDYLDEDGAVVTRLGSAPQAITGTASEATDTPDGATLTDLNADFPVADDALAGLFLRIVDGTGALQRRRIVSNTATHLVLDAPWDVLPDTTSKYRISTIPEDQTDGVLRAPRRILTVGTDGAGDEIHAGGGSDVVLGGAGDDVIAAGGGDDLVLGDAGRVEYKRDSSAPEMPRFGEPVVELPDRVRTVEFSVSGADTISGNAGVDMLFGGSGGDTMHGDDEVDSAGAADLADILVGDQGEAVYAEGVLTSVFTTDAADVHGAQDVITGGAGPDLILGGTADDRIDGGADNDIALGDFGAFDFHPSGGLPSRVESTDLTLGGPDTIYGGTDDDILIGGAGADLVDGDAGNDLMFGDAVVLTRAVGNTADLRFQTLVGQSLYARPGGGALVDGAPRRYRSPSGSLAGWIEFQIVDLFHSASIATDPANVGSFGDDYLAGGPDHDTIFGQLGNDIIQGDGAIDSADSASPVYVGAVVPTSGPLVVTPSFERTDDGDDYIEGNGGDDVIFGNLGQDDLVGGSSSLFTLTTAELRPDGSDIIIGGAGTRLSRNELVAESDVIFSERHARDADVIVGDNGNIVRVVGAAGVDSGAFPRFNYDSPAVSGYSATRPILPRTVQLVDYVAGANGAAPPDLGAPDVLHGESGDDQIWAMTGNDVVFGDSEDDDLIGGDGADRISGGAGEDGIAGDNGMFATSRNGLTEPLHAVTVANAETVLSVPGPFAGAVEYISGRLTKTFTALAWTDGSADALYGGLGDDFMHGGAGDDAMSGAEALPEFYVATAHLLENPLGYNAATRKLAAYDANDPRAKIAGFLLNFETVTGGGEKIEDGKDRMFGDLGHDWLVGGTGKDRLFGGLGDDLLNADDNHDTAGGRNDQPDSPAFADGDFAYGGGGLDVLIANTGLDRLIDWKGEFNSFIVPFSPFGTPTVIRSPSPHWQAFVDALGRTSGADPALAHPDSELGLTTADTGSPRDPQPGNIPGVARDTQGAPEDDRDLTPTAAGSTPTSNVVGGTTAILQQYPPGSSLLAANEAQTSTTALYVFGSSADDVIEVRSAGPSLLQVIFNGVSSGQFANNVSAIHIYGEAGDDTIVVNSNVGPVRAVIYGGTGDDTLTGGQGSNFLDGEDGNDTLRGGGGRDVLIGGLGLDVLWGGDGEDVLVGGVYKDAGDLRAVDAVLSEWSRTNAAYKARVKNLLNGGGLMDGFQFNRNRVTDDAHADLLTGGQNLDLFFLTANDDSDIRNNETIA